MTQKMSRFIYLTHSLSNHFDELSSLVMETEYLFKQESMKIEKRLSQLPESDKELRVEDYAEETVRFRDDYPNRFRKAMVVTWYTYTESAFEDIINVLKQVSESTKSILRNKDKSKLERLIDLFDEICSSKMIESELWPQIDNARLLRNNITHDNAVVKHTEKSIALVEYLERETNHFTLISKNQYTINQEYIGHLCEVSKDFLKKTLRIAIQQEKALVYKNAEEG